ncbi:MAG: class I SAM-dependent rRNA methyltransferase [Bdellovibrionales bacterium]|jgi:23S rRNA (cytosine1962-C5)-methyltransferase
MKLPLIRVHAARHKRAAGGHPWLFSNEIAMDAAAKALPAGSLVKFQAHDSSPLGIGTFNPHTLIAGRILSREPLVVIDKAWFAVRLRAALALREAVIAEPFYRLVHAEADGLGGLVIDRFGDHFSVQVNTAGMERLWPMIEAALVEVFQPQSIVLHNDSASRALEGLPREVRMALGESAGVIEIKENGLTYFTDLVQGQKTGWYFDQRDNHALVARFAKGQSVLDLYCHAGGFGLAAAKAGASSVVGVDSSAPALALAEKATAHNSFAKRCAWVKADVFDELEKRSAAKEVFDIVIADPPPFVKSKKDLAAGARGYRKLAKLSASVTAQGGWLFIATCSHAMDLATFTQEVARGLHEAKRSGAILYTCGAAPDHPIHPHLPESAYLKGLLIRLD